MNVYDKQKGRVICLFFMLAILASCTQSDKESTYFQTEGNAIGTTFHITYGTEKVDSLNEKIDSIIVEINHSLSTYISSSFITAFNENEEFEPTSSDLQHFVEMVNLSKTISNETSAAFDPTAAALFDLYSQAKKEGVLMNKEQVQECLKHQGIQKIQFDDQGFPYKLDSFVTINFNAIAKGYLVDIIADYLTAHGVTHYMVEVGGEMRVKGKNAEGKSWQVGINVPLIEARNKDFFKILELENVSLATSGNYQNFYKVDGELIGHTIDPRTGEPIVSNLKSATVLHDFCAVADAYATACMVLGLEESTKLIKGNSSLSAFFIYEEEGELKGIYIE